MDEGRKIILYIAVSLDGYIARPDGRVDWLDNVSEEDLGYEDFVRSIGGVAMGRTTYEQMLSFGPYPYSGMEGFVFTTARTGRDENVEFVDDVRGFVDRVRAEGGKDVWLVGGSRLIHSFMEAGAVDRFILHVIPVLLGEGIPLFRAPRSEQRVELRECRSFPNGVIRLTYEPAGWG